MTRLKAHAALMAFLFASATLLSACAYFTPEETVIPRPELLTAQEAGGGEQTPIGPDDLPGAADCGPDGSIYYSDPTGTRHGVQYLDGGRRIILGLLDNPQSILARGPQEINQLAHSDYCRMGKAYWGERADRQSRDWRVTPLDFGEGIAAFQAIEWRGKDSVPPEPVVEEGGWVYAVARAYGIVDDTYIMVRIDLENTSVEPPSEEELRALWDA
ncbi:hypothetical protein, partial [Schaalia canis]